MVLLNARHVLYCIIEQLDIYIHLCLDSYMEISVIQTSL